MTIKIEQIRSPIRRPGNKRAERQRIGGKCFKGPRPSSQRATLIGLRLNRIGRAAELPDTPQIRGMIAKVRHLVRMYPKLRVTFDSNAYRQAVDPGRSRRDAQPDELRKINAALKDGRIVGYLSETLVTLEGIRNAQRGAYFGSVQPKVSRALKRLPNGAVKLGLLVEANNSLHPGLHPIVARWVTAATSLGLKFLRAPRIGAPRPDKFLLEGNFAPESSEKEQRERQDRFGEIVQAMEARGLGMTRIKAIGEQIKARENLSGPWYSALKYARDEEEHREIQRAVDEWADGDTVAAHIAYGTDLLCSEDKGRGAGGPSIFDEANRKWLEHTYGIRILSLKQLAAELDK